MNKTFLHATKINKEAIERLIYRLDEKFKKRHTLEYAEASDMYRIAIPASMLIMELLQCMVDANVELYNREDELFIRCANEPDPF